MGHPPSANNGADYARFQAFGTCDRPELEEPADDRFSQYRESARCFLRPPSILFLAQRVVRLGAFINFLIQVRAPAAGELDTHILREAQSPEAVSGNEGKNAYEGCGRPAPTSDHQSQVPVKCETQAREEDRQGASDVRPARKPEGENDAAQSADQPNGEGVTSSENNESA